MNWYRNLVAAAGFGNLSFLVSFVMPLGIASSLGFLVGASTRVQGLGLAVAVIGSMLFLEFLRLRSVKRNKLILRAWPEVVDSVHSAFASGLTLEEAFRDLAVLGPKNLRASFATVSNMLAGQFRTDDCLNWLKLEFSTAPSDQLIESLRLIHSVGGNNALIELRNLAAHLRSEIATQNELAAKQGWVATTAKLGLVAPWVVVAILGQRKENAQIYNSSQGFLFLLVGLVICQGAYLIIQLFSAPLQPKRVFIREV